MIVIVLVVWYDRSRSLSNAWCVAVVSLCVDVDVGVEGMVMYELPRERRGDMIGGQRVTAMLCSRGGDRRGEGWSGRHCSRGGRCRESREGREWRRRVASVVIRSKSGQRGLLLLRGLDKAEWP